MLCICCQCGSSPQADHVCYLCLSFILLRHSCCAKLLVACCHLSSLADSCLFDQALGCFLAFVSGFHLALSNSVNRFSRFENLSAKQLIF